MQLKTWDDITASASIVIVGAGMAGLEVARWLEHSGATNVVLFESGTAADTLHANAATAVDTHHWIEPRVDPFFKRTWISQSSHFNADSGMRMRLGGRSLYWYGICLPIEPWALQEPWWPGSVVRDLTDSWRDGESLYGLVRSSVGLGSVDTERFDIPTMTVGHLEFRTSPRAVSPSADGTRWSAYSPLDYWRDSTTGEFYSDDDAVTVYCDTDVVDVLVDGDRAVGVAVRRTGASSVRQVSAETIVLSAGTIASSRLAIQAMSTVVPEAGCRLGNLSDHIVQGFSVKSTDSPDAVGMAVGNFYAHCPQRLRSNVFLDVSDNGGIWMDVRATGEQLPDAGSFVELLGQPGGRLTSVRSSLSNADRLLVAQQRTVLDELWWELARSLGVTYAPLQFDDFDSPIRTQGGMANARSQAVVTWSRRLGTEDHEGGTLAFGRVIDADQQFHSIESLYACGPATFPRMGAANPAMTILALSRRLAGCLSQKH